MRRQQKGITFIGWLVLLIPVAILGYAVIRLTPVYLNYMKVARTLEQTATEFQGDEQINAVAVRRSMQRRYDVESIDYPPIDSILVRREGDKWVLRATYEDVVPLFGGISLLVKFDKSEAVQ